MDFKIINVKLQFLVINSLKTLHKKPSVKFLVVSSVCSHTYTCNLYIALFKSDFKQQTLATNGTDQNLGGGGGGGGVQYTKRQ